MIIGPIMKILIEKGRTGDP